MYCICETRMYILNAQKLPKTKKSFLFLVDVGFFLIHKIVFLFFSWPQLSWKTAFCCFFCADTHLNRWYNKALRTGALGMRMGCANRKILFFQVLLWNRGRNWPLRNCPLVSWRWVGPPASTSQRNLLSSSSRGDGTLASSRARTLPLPGRWLHRLVGHRAEKLKTFCRFWPDKLNMLDLPSKVLRLWCRTRNHRKQDGTQKTFSQSFSVCRTIKERKMNYVSGETSVWHKHLESESMNSHVFWLDIWDL